MSATSGFARRLGRWGAILRTGVRTLSGLDTNPVPADWRHITKIDPEADKQLPLLYPLYLSHTSAISVGGSSDVTSQNTEETFTILDRIPVPTFHEPSAAKHVTNNTRTQCDFMAIPEVLNGDVESLVGELGAGAEYIREELVPPMIEEKLPWVPDRFRTRLADFATTWLLERAIFEAYIIQNPDSAAARESGVTADDLLSPAQAAQRALAAEKHLESEVIYLEYSGTFGGEEATDILAAVSEAIGWSRLWYGGGLYARADARAVLEAGADAVVVGNVFHEIAAEETAFVEQAVDALEGDSIDLDTARSWVDETVTIAETNAARYLSTIPDIADPHETASEYLAATVTAWLELESLADQVPDDRPSDAAIRQFVDEHWNDALPGAVALAEVLGDDGHQLAREVALFHLDRRFGTAAGSLPLAHLGPL